MGNFGLVKQKLEAFIKKYYLNLILKGSILFLATGLLYFLLITALEYFLWLSTLGRSILFWLFILVEFLLLFKFVGIPLFRLLKISKGIDEFQASEIIGKHFPEVQDKLTNLLQLQENSKKSDLLLASIEQRSRELTPVPFTNAIDLRENKKYVRYVVLPFLIILGLILAGETDMITNSFHRIIDYNTTYLRPAPFNFIIQNNELKAREGEKFRIQVKTIGDYNPENVQIIFDDGGSFMKQTAPGIFEYTISNISEDLDFKFRSNDVSSNNHTIEVIRIPKLLNFEMDLDYPAYTGLKNEKLSGTGNITVPEGTVVNWKFSTRNVLTVNFKTPDTLIEVHSDKDNASYNKRLRSNLQYEVSTSNALVKYFEPLEYQVKVIKDQYPKIKVTTQKDSLNTDIQYFKGDVSDDYGLSKLQLVYYTESEKKDPNTIDIPVSNESFDEFHFSFPGNIDLEAGESYDFFFRIFDNDAVNGAKSASSQTFSYRKKTSTEISDEKLKEQNDAIRNISDRLEEYEKSDEELKDIYNLEKEKEELNYNERKKLEEFLKRQKRQNEMMKSYSEKLKKSLEKNDENESPMQKELSERLENNEKRLEENEELLKELEKYSEKIQKEDLGKKLEELSKQNKNNQRNLEQLLELTKRYYVEEKKQKLARDLDDLSERQKELSDNNDQNSEENNVENQEKLNEEFEDFQKMMDELEKENRELKQPQNLGREEVEEESIKKDQEDAKESIKNNEGSKASEKQKDASRKMKQISQKMQQSSSMQQQEQLEADAETLRQILDNLIVFSFEQEYLLDDFKTMQQNNPKYAGKLKEQSNLRENFRHIDDSLYSLAMRNPMVNEVITDKLTNIEFDLAKSLERLSDNEIPQGTSSQQYVVTGANDLANLLDQILSSMQQMMGMPQPGSGKGEQEFQLQDIIQQQKELNEKMNSKTDGEKTKDRGKPKEEGEGMNGELFEIYKEQQRLRMQMEQMMQENGMESGNKATEDMKRIEEQLLDKGFDPETLKRMQQLEYELLKFEKAFKLQGTDDKRKSATNKIDYENRLNNQMDRAKEYFNSTEILNRQTLPLRQIYKEKVKDYFGKGRD
ncbi:hypothetical protein ML462_04805 [Gramella lutea]|uniref:DUF4175 family protein n=1 Tax=Christiangramia lutea TaxID=1607951 RepID=A0A9X1V1P2_9FLAO|nr:DUF4175 family protein [Christiangramia lutea]MCH4822484.1 hypothetical protein [Christiangramia lutea]